MAVARLGNITMAMDFIMKDAAKNVYNANGCQDQFGALVCYTPANGALLASTGMLAGGWDGGPAKLADRFPAGFNVKAEGFAPLF